MLHGYRLWIGNIGKEYRNVFNNIHSILIERKHQYLKIIFHGNFAHDYPNYNQHKQNWSTIILLQGYKLYNYNFIIKQ